MWIPVEGLAGVSGEVPGPASSHENSTGREQALANPRYWSWLPPLDRTPPVVQFVVHAAQWFKARCNPGAKQNPQLRLVGQLSLGAKRHLSLVEVGGMQFLVGGGVEHVTVIVPIPTVLNNKDARSAGRELEP